MTDIDTQIANYIKETARLRASFQSKLFSIFTETTGYRPDDICIVERKTHHDLGEATVFYFDLKSRCNVLVATTEGE